MRWCDRIALDEGVADRLIRLGRQRLVSRRSISPHAATISLTSC